MANEAVIIELLGNSGDPVRGAVYDTDAFEKGAILCWEDARRLSGSTLIGGSQIPAGIAATEKVAGDGSTSLAVYTNGVFGLKSYVCTAGDSMVISGANYVSPTNPGLTQNKVLGIALEAGATTDVVAVKVKLYIWR